MAETTLVWLRNDLRLADNPALAAAIGRGGPGGRIYMSTKPMPTLRPRGAASRWWLHQSLNALAAQLADIGIPLETVRGRGRANAARRYSEAPRQLPCSGTGATRPPNARSMRRSSRGCMRRALIAKSYPGNVLVEPFEIATRTGSTLRGLHPVLEGACSSREIAAALPAPQAA